jgi:hypothetical protein
MELTPSEHLRSMLNKDKVRSRLQDDTFFISIISVCVGLDKKIYTGKRLAKIVSVPEAKIKLWKLGRELPSPSMRVRVFDWIREDLDRKIGKKKPS